MPSFEKRGDIAASESCGRSRNPRNEMLKLTWQILTEKERKKTKQNRKDTVKRCKSFEMVHCCHWFS